MTSLEQQFQQMIETGNRMPGDLQQMAYIALAATLILAIVGLRKTHRYWFKLDQSARDYTGWGGCFYGGAFLFICAWGFFQSLSNITSMVK